MFVLYKSKITYNPENLDIFSYIPQEINLMEDTLFENIKFDFISKYDGRKIEKLLKNFKLNKEIEINRNKNISNKISGGQKQRILICRAYIIKKK